MAFIWISRQSGRRARGGGCIGCLPVGCVPVVLVTVVIGFALAMW